MIMSHEDVLAQLQMQFHTHRDVRIYKLNVQPPHTKFFAGYRVYQMDVSKLEGGILTDFFLTEDGWRTRTWVRQADGEALKDQQTGEIWVGSQHGTVAKEISMNYIASNLQRLHDEQERKPA